MDTEIQKTATPLLRGTSLSESPILIVDDQSHNVDLLKRILSREGYSKITTCTDPTQTISLFSQIKPDLILLDLNMPIMDGFEVMTSLRETFSDTDIKESSLLH